ncbi:MAG: hypothetical protein PUK16_06870 [Prevotellaceae bacterium]|nr:hypothetical protein [Prevotella sp.]MDD7530655.1 hypothetical protein [Prevotellaceae bacterium]MDY2634470.1 hypothetical protein [Prevotella sp.]
MKKSLLMCAAVAAVTAANAQDVAVKSGLSMSDLSNAISTKEVVKASTSIAPRFAPRKSYEDGVFYATPKGSFQLVNNKYCYLFLPPYKEVKFINKSTDKSSTSWQINNTNVPAEMVDGDNNLKYTLSGLQTNALFFAPSLTAPQKVAFTFGKSDATQTGIVHAQDGWPAAVYDIGLTGLFHAWLQEEGVWLFGTSTRTIDGKDMTPTVFRQRFDKPAGPTRINKYICYFDSKSELPFSGDNKITFTMYKDKGNGVKGDVMAVYTFGKENITTADKDPRGKYTWDASKGEGFGYANLENTLVDEFGNPLPVVVKDAFIMEVTGMNQDGMDLGFNFTEPARIPMNEYYPTEIDYVDGDGNVQTLTQEVQNGGHFNLFFAFSISMDGIKPFGEGIQYGVAPVEGGQVPFNFTFNDGKQAGFTAFNKANSWTDADGNNLYELIPEQEGGYDWLEYEMDNSLDVADKEEDGKKSVYSYITILNFTAQALPAGTEGRVATYYIKGVNGAEQAFHIAQGSGPIVDGIETPTVETVKANKATFNLSGQRVNDSYKGIVIENGKKVIK